MLDPLRLAPELPPAWREIIGDCLAPSHDARAPHDARSLLRRIEQLQLPTGVAESRGRKRLLLSAALVTAVCTAAAGTAFLLGPDDTNSPTAKNSNTPSAPAGTPSATPVSPVAYGRCIPRSVCFFTESDGGGRMCAWVGDEADWLAGKNVCSWAGTTAPRSVFNNGKGAAAGETLFNGTYFADKHLQKEIGCVPPRYPPQPRRERVSAFARVDGFLRVASGQRETLGRDGESRPSVSLNFRPQPVVPAARAGVTPPTRAPVASARTVMVRLSFMTMTMPAARRPRSLTRVRRHRWVRC
ncbi:peptidase inhibitor family I36 protein [Embleya sp. NPDC020630]|uniref:peptidase inhibitor family I36 protein n=1 Tax=Embleya sp. NPDC020630 TaxID=3363979 RepID=UPI0037BDCBCC